MTSTVQLYSTHTVQTLLVCLKQQSEMLSLVLSKHVLCWRLQMAQKILAHSQEISLSLPQEKQ